MSSLILLENKKINALSLVINPVPPRLHDINLARARPRTVVVVDGEHPERRPQPVAARDLRDDLDLAVLDVVRVLGREARGLHGVDHGAGGGVRDGAAGRHCGRSIVSAG